MPTSNILLLFLNLPLPLTVPHLRLTTDIRSVVLLIILTLLQQWLLGMALLLILGVLLRQVHHLILL